MRHALENVFRRRFFAVNLVLLALAAVLLARTVTVVLGHVATTKLAEQGAGKAPVVRTPPPPVVMRDFQAASEQNIFEARRENLSGTPVAEPAGPPPEPGDCTGTPTSTGYRLVGTVVFSEPTFSVASIAENGKQGTRMFTVNDCVVYALDPNDPDSKLAPSPPPCSKIFDSSLVLRSIQPELVCIWNESDHRMEHMAIDEQDNKAPPVAAAVPKPDEGKPASPDDLGSTIRKTGESSYEVGQDDVNKALNNLADLTTQARVVPAFEGGKTVGFKLFSIRPGSLYQKIGLQNGDVITRINGYEMTDPAKGFEIYGKLKDAKQITVDMKRRGKPMTLDYSITP